MSYPLPLIPAPGPNVTAHVVDPPGQTEHWTLSFAGPTSYIERVGRACARQIGGTRPASHKSTDPAADERTTDHAPAAGAVTGSAKEAADAEAAQIKTGRASPESAAPDPHRQLVD